LRADGTLRPPRPPRSGILSTGEDVPAGHSLRARLITVPVAENEVNLDTLSDRQAAGSWYSKAMAAFLRWLAGDRSMVLAWFERSVHELRRHLLSRLPHGRTATAGAELMLGLRVFLMFAADVGAITDEQARDLERRGGKAIRITLAKQAEYQAASDPAQLFIQIISAALMAGDVHLADKDTGGMPPTEDLARATGWQRAEAGEGKTSNAEWRQRGSQIGWVDAKNDAVYFIPAAAYRAAQKQAETSPTRIGIGERALSDRLDEARLLVSKDRGRRTKKMSIRGRHTNVLHLRLSVLLGATGTTGTEEENPAGNAPEGAVFPLSVPDPVALAGTANGNNGAWPGPAGPSGAAVPVVPAPGVHTQGAAPNHDGGGGAREKMDAFTMHVADLFDATEYDDVG
jgi:hypothetical protein